MILATLLDQSIHGFIGDWKYQYSRFSYIAPTCSKSIIVNRMSLNSTGSLLHIPTPFGKHQSKGHIIRSSTNGSSSLSNGPKTGLDLRLWSHDQSRPFTAHG